MKDAITLEGREGARSERSRSLMNLPLVSVSMLKTDLSSNPSESRVGTLCCNKSEYKFV